MQSLLRSTQAYTLLETEAREHRLGHAYLLLFDDARNLRDALKTFAKPFFGLNDLSDPAQKRVSELIDAESFSDCLFFPSPDKKLTVEDAEKIQEECTLNPVEGEKKMFVIGDFAEANVQTQNKLLKLLEEPPQGVVFLLGATSVFPVLQTVLSRTEKLEIQPFDTASVIDCLIRIYGDKFDRNTLALCAAASGGNVGEAQNMAEGGQYRSLIENAFALALANPSRLPALTRQVGETKYKKELLGLLRILFRDALLIKIQSVGRGNTAKELLLAGERAKLEKIAEKYSPSALLYAQEAISAAESQVKFNAVFSQCIELCIANILEKNNAV